MPSYPLRWRGWLGEYGHEADHVADLGMEGASDSAIWSRALETNAVIVTKDQDFFQRYLVDGGGPCIVWVRLGNTRRPQLLAWFAGLLPGLIRALERGDRLIELA